MNLHKITDDEREQIENKMWQVAEYEEGDWVTVEPRDYDFAVHGDEYVGIPLKIDGVYINSHTLCYDARAEKYRNYDDSKTVGEYYVNGVRYEVAPINKFWDVRSDHFDEDTLIPWDEYDGVVSIEADRSTDTRILNDREPCPVCECETRVVSEMNNEVQTVGSENCAACDYQFEFWD